jgi:hypothetical protein
VTATRLGTFLAWYRRLVDGSQARRGPGRLRIDQDVGGIDCSQLRGAAASAQSQVLRSQLALSQSRTIAITSSFERFAKACQGVIGARVLPSGRVPICKAVTIRSEVQLPMPVSLSGVMFLPENAPRPGISNATPGPPRNCVVSGLPKKYPDVWRSLHSPRVTRYLPRSVYESARAVVSRGVTVETANR